LDPDGGETPGNPAIRVLHLIAGVGGGG